jgi:hypothetical protein
MIAKLMMEWNDERKVYVLHSLSRNALLMIFLDISFAQGEISSWWS